eukprot:gnl/TRDRNA2_/TRDRNA2_155254_c0_seq1.p1 gnl/TRDRNA2_/TRDRNA2_155254_c0~~gnl/TRDRNA2_/TRDRNA2_155254_c0_seq1.p1  ORF type:complete len:101 (+),score=6.31 gnl/TRDRNA2_/TRDRNA2_155254_c0_seq1:27-305(+)
MWRQGSCIRDDGWEPKRISLDWKVRDLVTESDFSNICLGRTPKSGYGPKGNFRDVCFLVGPAATLDLDDPASFEKPLSVLGVSAGCKVYLDC